MIWIFALCWSGVTNIMTTIEELQKKIEELEAKVKYEKQRTQALFDVWYEGGNSTDELKECLSLLYSKEFIQEHFDMFEEESSDEEVDEEED